MILSAILDVSRIVCVCVCQDNLSDAKGEVGEDVSSGEDKLKIIGF